MPGNDDFSPPPACDLTVFRTKNAPEEMAATASAVSRILSADSQQSGHLYCPEPVCLSLSADNRIVAGLTGRIQWDWLYIETLAVEVGFRGRGLGTKLVLSAEAIAQTANCIGIWADTYTFQSPDFYRRLGYSEFGRLPDNPRGQSRVFLQKIF